MDEGPSLITTDVVLGRMRDYGVIGVSQTASLIMGGVFATAAVTFIDILRAQDALPVRLTGWLLGVVASLMVFDSLIRRSILEARPVFHAVPIVGAAGILSMLGFALLSAQSGGADGWRYSSLVLLIAGVLFGRSWGGTFADHVEPALQALYQRHDARTAARWRVAWPIILAASAPFVLSIADKYGGLPLRWPIAAANLALSVAHLLSMLRAHRYMESVYQMAYAAHAAKLRPPVASGVATAGQ
jgi:hypothetical protein